MVLSQKIGVIKIAIAASIMLLTNYLYLLQFKACLQFSILEFNILQGQ